MNIYGTVKYLFLLMLASTVSAQTLTWRGGKEPADFYNMKNWKSSDPKDDGHFYKKRPIFGSLLFSGKAQVGETLVLRSSLTLRNGILHTTKSTGIMGGKLRLQRKSVFQGGWLKNVDVRLNGGTIVLHAPKDPLHNSQLRCSDKGWLIAFKHYKPEKMTDVLGKIRIHGKTALEGYNVKIVGIQNGGWAITPIPEKDQAKDSSLPIAQD